MSHYTKNVQSLLTGGFKVLNMILKSKFSVKDKTKELCFADYCYRRFSQKNIRVWEITVLLMEMNTDLKVSLVSKIRQRNFASLTTFIGVFFQQQEVLKY